MRCHFNTAKYPPTSRPLPPIDPSQHIPVEAEREDVRDWVLSVCMDAKIDQALIPEREASGTLYQVHTTHKFHAVVDVTARSTNRYPNWHLSFSLGVRNSYFYASWDRMNHGVRR